jgi:hypothetical protein
MVERPKIGAKKRPRGRPFRPGQTGNAGGRPKEGAGLRDLCRAHSNEAIETLLGIMRNKRAPAAARLRAVSEILDRGFGRPQQFLETGDEVQRAVDKPSELEIARRIFFVLDRPLRTAPVLPEDGA